MCNKFSLDSLIYRYFKIVRNHVILISCMKLNTDTVSGTNNKQINMLESFQVLIEFSNLHNYSLINKNFFKMFNF